MKKKKHLKKIDSLVYMVSSLASFGLLFLINVIMTNYSISDEIYGKYKYAVNFALTMPAIFSFGITWSCASLIARDDVKNKDGIITASLIYTLIIGVIVTVGLYIVSGITSVLRISAVQDAIIVFPFVTVFLIQKLVDQIYMGLGQATRLSLYNVAPNILICIGLALHIFFFKSINFQYAIMLHLISYVIVIVPKLLEIKYSFNDFKDNTITLFEDIRTSGFKVHFSSIFTTSATQIIVLVCGKLFGYSEYGYYSLAASLATIFQFIGSSVAVVNFRHYANIDSISRKDIYFMTILGGAAYCCMYFLIDIVFYWFYPESYGPTILYLKILCLSNLIYGFSMLFNRFFIGKGYGGNVMKVSFITAVATVLINVPMIVLFGMRGMAIAVFVVSVVNLFVYVYEYNIYISKER
ncbi:oligosaccharide flippase family protein [Streptococcus suis]|nr:oligosaccharide flippase family protein [Streptococcus suis]